MSLRDIEAEMRLARGSAELAVTSRVQSGGRLGLRGRASLRAPYRLDLVADIADLRVSDPGFYETSVNGQLSIQGPVQTGGAAVLGRLELAETEIRVPDGAGGAGGALPGLVHLAEPRPVRETRARAGLIAREGSGGGGSSLNAALDVTIAAPARIFVRGRGLDAELGGALRLRGTTSDVITAGRFDLIRGRLDILGKRLTLSEASVQLQGDFDPYLRAVATTQVEDTLVQVLVEGLASAPEVRFSSVPELPEDEILARLLFGRDITEISALQALQLANAVRVLSGQSGEGVVGRLRRDFGLDDLDLATSDDGEVGLRAGKYISDNAYTDVTVDTSGRSEINLNLSLSPSVTLRGSAASDGSTGVGIFFERDY
jgi:translocation and assembly module TamB